MEDCRLFSVWSVASSFALLLIVVSRFYSIPDPVLAASGLAVLASLHAAWELVFAFPSAVIGGLGDAVEVVVRWLRR